MKKSITQDSAVQAQPTFGQTRRTLLLGAGALLIAARTVRAATPTLTAEQVVARNVQARGGLAAWRGIGAMAMSGLMDAGRIRPEEPLERDHIPRLRLPRPQDVAQGKMVRLPFELELKRPRKMRLEITFDGQKAVQVFDGTHGWKLRPFLGRHEVENYTPQEARAGAEQQDLDGPLIDHAAKGIAVALEGMEQVEGHDAYKLKLTLKDGRMRRVWVDAQSYLDVMIDGERRLDGKAHVVHTHYRDFRKVNDVLIPFTLETRVQGVHDSETISIDKVALNPPLSDARFARPA